MIINEVVFHHSLSDIILELQSQLRLNHIHLLEKTSETSNDIMVQCPYHSNGQERRPSAGISKDNGTFHCFACGEVHTLPEVISHCFNHDDDMGKYGWIWLLKNFATISIEQRKAIPLNYSREKKSCDPEYISEEELDSYRYYHPYWSKRKIESDWILDLFDLGYDKKTECITFPIRDINGNCLYIARRSVHTKFFSYPDGVKKPVYGLYEIVKFYDSFSKDHSKAQCLDFDFDIDSTRPIGVNSPQEIIICESMIDALTCWEYGKCAVALNGLGTPDQFEELRKFPCRKYILATDMDEKGLNARERIKKALNNKLVTQYFWNLKDAKDINDMSQDYFLNLHDVL